MQVPLLARTGSPTFYLYRRTIFLSLKIKHVKIIRAKFKTSHVQYLWKIKCYKALSSLQHVYFAFEISGQSSSLKATGYTGYNHSIYSFAIHRDYNMGRQKRKRDNINIPTYIAISLCLSCFNETCLSNKNNFIVKDTMETASHFICKDCLQT